MIPQYEPTHQLTTVPADVLDRHWTDAAEQLRRKLRSFLAVPNGIEILPVSRCSAAIQLAAEWFLRRARGTYFGIHERSYRTVVDAVEAAGGNWVAFDEPYLTYFDVKAPAVPIHETITGTLPNFAIRGQYIYDCAHTAYPRMMEGVALAPGQFVCLSFYPTKPIGGGGGGALLMNADLYTELKHRAWPVSRGTPCLFSVMQSVQCFLAERAMDLWDEASWRRREDLYVKVRAAAMCRFHGLVPTYHALLRPVTPHLLSFVGDPGSLYEFQNFMRRNGVETGYQYDKIWGPLEPRPVAIPFHNQEVLRLLGGESQ